MPILPTINNRKIVKAIVAVARTQTLSPAFNRGRALEIAARLEMVLDRELTDESTYALCALLVKGMGITDPRELADLLRG